MFKSDSISLRVDPTYLSYLIQFIEFIVRWNYLLTQLRFWEWKCLMGSEFPIQRNNKGLIIRRKTRVGASVWMWKVVLSAAARRLIPRIGWVKLWTGSAWKAETEISESQGRVPRESPPVDERFESALQGHIGIGKGSWKTKKTRAFPTSRLWS